VAARNSKPAAKSNSSPSGQTLRERFRRTMHFEKPDGIPFFEFGYWDETLPTWHEQGLPRSVDTEERAYEYFGIEDFAFAPANHHIMPLGEREIISETETTVTFRAPNRVIGTEQKGTAKSIPHFIEFPVKTREDWKWFKERLNADTPGRIPTDFAETAKRLNAGDRPVVVSYASICGVIRDLMGFEDYAIATLLDPEFVCEMMDDLTNVSVTVLERAFAAGLKVDAANGWEDITFNSGPIVHPDFFYREAISRYKRITDVLHRNGCDIIWIDSDGNINRLVDGWLEAGINCMFPLEVNGGTDPVALREKYGHRILLMGGIDKMKLAGSKDAILKELKRLQPVVDDGAFIPHVDHRCPPNVPLANYIYYLDAKRDLFGAGKLQPQYK
jgi:uroporphyrinogen-III decarboxylase